MTDAAASPILEAALRSLTVDCGAATLATAAAATWVLLAVYLGGSLGRWAVCLGAAFLLVPTYAVAGCFSSSGGPPAWLEISPTAAAGRPALAIAAVVWIHAVAKLPLAILLLAAAMRRVDSAAAQVAMLEGGWPAVLGRAIWPAVAATLLPVWLGCCLLTHADMVVSNLYQVETLTELSYLNISLGRRSPAVDVACVAVAVLLAAATCGSAAAVLRRQAQMASGRGGGVWGLPPPAKIRRAAAALVLLAVATPSVLVPLANLTYKAGYVPAAVSGGEGHAFSAARAAASVAGSGGEFADEFRWTAELVLWSTAAAAGIAIVLLTINHRWPRSTLWMAVVAAGLLALPGPVINLAAIRIFNRPGTLASFLYNDTLAVCVACLQPRLLPIVWALLWVAWRSSHRRYGERWALEPTGRLGRLGLYTGAMRGPLLAAAAVAAAVAAGELNSYLLVLPPGVTTLAMRIFDLLHYAVRYREAGLLLLLAAAGAVLAVGLTRRYVV